jgi:hypothetical protein
MRYLLWLVGVFGVFTILRIIFQFHLFDFSIYYKSVLDLQNGISMYRDPTIAMKYPMSAMILLVPIGWFPYIIIEKLWTFMSVAALLIGLFFMHKILPNISRQQWWYIGAAIILSFPYKFTLGMGQINLMILAMLIGSIYAHLNNRDVLAGIFIALSAWLKITPLVLLPYFWRKGRYKTVGVALAVYVLGWIMAGEIWGFEFVREFFVEVIPSISTLDNEVYYNQALTGLIARLGIAGNFAAILNYFTFGLMLVVSYFITPKSRSSSDLEIVSFGLFVSSILLGAGLAWQHYFVWTIFSFVGIYATNIDDKEHSHLTWVGLIVAYILIAINIKNPANFSGWQSIFLSHATFGTILLWLIGVKTLSRSL